MVAFLLNQMNVGAFKINTMEKLDSSSNGKSAQSSSKSDFSKELRSAVEEKRKSGSTDTPNVKKFEKKFSKVNHDSKEKAKLLNNDKVSEKKNEQSQPAKKVETDKVDDKKLGSSQEDVKSVADNNETQKKDTVKTDDVNGKSTEDQKTVAAADETTVAKTSTDGTDGLNQINGDLAKIVEQLVGIMQNLQQSGNNSVAPTKDELTKATELLDKLKTGKIEPADAFNELGKLMESIKTSTVGKGEGVGVNSEFQKLMELTNNKLNVLKNELADAKDQMNKISANANNQGKLTGRMSEALGTKTEEIGQVAQDIQKSGATTVDNKKPQTAAEPEKTVTNQPTEGAEELGALQTKKTALTQDDKTRKAAAEETIDAKVAAKSEALKADTKANSGNTENESFSNADTSKATEGTPKTEKSSDGISFQTVAQNSVKEAEKPVETGRMSRTPILDKAEVLSQIVKKADLLVGKTQSEMIMKLEPENLGKVTLKIAMERGTMTASFQAENQQVKAMIESNTDSLRDMLQEKGINVTAINVSVNQQSGDNQSWKNQNQGQFNENTFGKKEGLGNRGNSMIGTYGIVGMTDAINSKINPYTKHDGEFDFRG